MLITLDGAPARILGLNPNTRALYVFSTALVGYAPGFTEITDIAVMPNDPTRVVVIGNLDNNYVGIRQLDSCGQGAQLFGSFPQTLPPPAAPQPKSAMINRGLVWNPVTGTLLSPGINTVGLNGPDLYGSLYTFALTGGAAAVSYATGDNLVDSMRRGAVAADDFGNVYVGQSNGDRIAKIAFPSMYYGMPQQVELPTSGLSGIKDMVYDGYNHLFVAGGDAYDNGHIWRVDALTGVTRLLVNDRGPQHGYETYNSFKGITVDANGAIWAVESDYGPHTRAAVVKISGVDGTELDYFSIPSSFAGEAAATAHPTGIAVLGENLPAVEKSCALDCDPGKIPDCNGTCMSANWLGDNYCDGNSTWNMNCWARGMDGDDCNPCPENQVPDCNGNCGPKWWVGDPTCDDGGWYFNGQLINFDCAQFRFDEGTCRGCGWGETLDCNGECSPDSWYGDNVCDDGSYTHLGHPVQYDCVEYDFDRYDCH